MLLKFQDFWSKNGCTILPQYDIEMGAGTFHPETFFRSITDYPWNCAFIQSCRRPSDGRYGNNPNRMQKFHQYQVTLKPSPINIQDIYLKSLNEIGLNTKENEIRFIEDNWESPSLGASGIGWEVQCNGMEVTQFTYFQQFASINCKPTTVEITYGIERIAMVIQDIWNVYDLKWSDSITYRDLFYQQEKEFSEFNFQKANTDLLLKNFNEIENECKRLLEENLILPAYEYCIKASHIFNIIEARGVIGTAERHNFIIKIRSLAAKCAEKYLLNMVK